MMSIKDNLKGLEIIPENEDHELDNEELNLSKEKMHNQ